MSTYTCRPQTRSEALAALRQRINRLRGRLHTPHLDQMERSLIVGELQMAYDRLDYLEGINL